MEQLEKHIGNKCFNVTKSALLECQSKSNDNNEIHFACTNEKMIKIFM